MKEVTLSNMRKLYSLRNGDKIKWTPKNKGEPVIEEVFSNMFAPLNFVRIKREGKGIFLIPCKLITGFEVSTKNKIKRGDTK